jgi:hypothetical protein
MASAITLLEDRIETLEKRERTIAKEIGELKDLLNVHENWNSEIKKMYGKKVDVYTNTGTLHKGELIWSDRYCICIFHDVRKTRVTMNKGGISSIELSK